MHWLREYSLPLLLAVALHGAAVAALYRGWSPDKEAVNLIKPRTVMADLLVLQPKAKPAPPPVKQAPAPAPKPKTPAQSKPQVDPAEQARRRSRQARGGESGGGEGCRGSGASGAVTAIERIGANLHGPGHR